MIRVAFVVASGPHEWIGGMNYLVNLLHAIAAVPQPRIKPVIITAQSTPPSFLAAFPDIEVVRTRFLNGRWFRACGKLGRLLLGRDMLMEWLLKAHRIDVLSHSANLGPRARIPTIQWLADFQHRRLPKLFEPAEVEWRDGWFSMICESATRILVSSNDSRADLEAFDPVAATRGRVLHFVSAFGKRDIVDGIAELEARYSFQGPYFHLPNQYWAHKNHGTMIEALALLKAKGIDTLVLSTGHTRDRRNPDYFPALEHRIQALGLEQSFRILGIVPYSDLAGLMTHARAVINPSLFEGWSTTVEEAKSLGKTVILSDIPVHREQAPARGIYFDPSDPQSLADCIEACLQRNEDEAPWRVAAAEALTGRVIDFGRRYEEIALETYRAGSRPRNSGGGGASG